MENNFAVIFDMDGVIIDSNPLISSAWKSFFLAHDIDLSSEQLAKHVFGRTAKDTLCSVFNKELTQKELEDYTHIVSRNVQQLYSSHGVIVPGIKDFIKQLKINNVQLGLATSGTPEDVSIVLGLAGITSDFSAIFDSSKTHRPKPNPEVYLKTAEALRIDPNNCCVFEDSFSGIQAAKAAGMKVIGITTTHSAAELLPYTDDVIADYTEIDMQYLQTFF